jgi:hypothetical protein
MELQVIVSKVDLDRRRIDFALEIKDNNNKSMHKKSSVSRSKSKKSNKSATINKNFKLKKNNSKKPTKKSK